MLYHRNVRVLDTLFARMLHEIAGASIAQVVIVGLFVAMSWIAPPSDVFYMLMAWFLMAMFFALVIAIGYLAAWVMGNPAILYIAVFFALVMNIGSYWFSDKLVLSMTGAQPVTREQAPDLYNIVVNLAITSGLPMPKVYIVVDSAPNAFATGRDP